MSGWCGNGSGSGNGSRSGSGDGYKNSVMGAVGVLHHAGGIGKGGVFPIWCQGVCQMVMVWVLVLVPGASAG